MEFTIAMVDEECCKCYAVFAMTTDTVRRLKRERLTFWCPYCGTSQHYTGKSAEQELREEKRRLEQRLASEQSRHDQTRADRDHEKKRRAAFQGVAKKMKNRIGKGVCPCCNRSFENIRRHMETKHPEFGS